VLVLFDNLQIVALLVQPFLVLLAFIAATILIFYPA
jgi:hypothetical protein